MDGLKLNKIINELQLKKCQTGIGIMQDLQN